MKENQIELRDVLDVLDTWIGQQRGIQHMQFSYEVGEHRIVLQIGKRKERPEQPVRGEEGQETK